MRVCGVIAEFNPFHNGHAHLLNTLKADGSAVVAVMSGNFVQRGDAAILSKFARAKMAVLGGCDLVLELPLPYSVSTAMYFAEGAVQILKAFGVVDTLAFGSECGEINKLLSAANFIGQPNFSAELKRHLETGITFAAARQQAAEALSTHDVVTALSNPNDTLAIEYILAARRTSHPFHFVAVARRGTAHDSAEISNGFASASQLRKRLQNNQSVEGLLPPAVLSVLQEEQAAGRIAALERLERGIVAYLRCMPRAALQNLPDISEGLENRISLAANSFSTLAEVVDAVKTKRYTHARLRRIVLAAYLGITADLQRLPPPYIRVLGMNERGADLLRQAKGLSTLPIVASLKDAERQSAVAERFATLEVKAGDIFTLLYQNAAVGKTEYTARLYKTF